MTNILPNTVYHGIITLTVHWYTSVIGTAIALFNSTLALISGLGLGLKAFGLGLETPGLVNIPAAN